MQSVSQLISVAERVKGIPEAGLSLGEAETLKFLKDESDKLASIAKELDEVVAKGDFKGAIQALTRLIVRVNVMGSLALQPAVLSSLGNPNLRNSLVDLVGSALSIIEETYFELLPKAKDNGVKSFTLNVNTNPLSVVLSMGTGE